MIKDFARATGGSFTCWSLGDAILIFKELN
jgi:hypothetical protein